MAKPKAHGPNITTQRISELMKEQRITQIALSDSLNKSPQTICRWVNGKVNISATDLERVAVALNTTTDYLRGIPGGHKSRADKEAAEADYQVMFGDELCAEDPTIGEEKQRRTIRNRFFSTDIGYSYHEAPSGLSDFGGTFCTLKDQSGHEYSFSFEEFQQLMTQIKDMVDFACFKNRNVVRDCGGIRPEPQERG